MHKESNIRSIVKGITWRFLATLTTVSLVLLFTGKADVALAVGGIEVFLKIFIYFLHERGWGKIRWGKQEIQPFVVWITGLSGSGKTSMARMVAENLNKQGLRTDHLDGETIRGLFPRTGFTRGAVIEHIERVGLLASRLEESGVFVVASFISPYLESREFVRNLCHNYVEVHVSTPVEVCEERDRKGLYQRARKGEIQHFPGIDVDYELTDRPELEIDTTSVSVEEAAERIVHYLKRFM